MSDLINALIISCGVGVVMIMVWGLVIALWQSWRRRGCNSG